MIGVTQWRRPLPQLEAAQNTDAGEAVARLVRVAMRVVVGTLVMGGMLMLMTVMIKL